MSIYLLINLFLILAWFAPILLALLVLRRCDVPETARAVWTLVIVTVPLLGPIAFLLAGAKPRATH